jgi:AcrR family transcriptional regulator
MPPPRAEDAPDRRQEILAAALELLAEEGYAGASLRKLAARLGIAQPSLYHYFRTKEDLVEQVLDTYVKQMFSVVRPEDLPTRLEQIPRFAAETTLRVYESPTHALFVRVAISVSRTHPRFGALMRRFFVDQARFGIQQIMRPYVEAGEIAAGDGQDLVHMVINAIGLRLIEDKVMFAEHEPGPDFERYVAFVVRVAEAWLAGLRRPAETYAPPEPEPASPSSAKSPRGSRSIRRAP